MVNLEAHGSQMTYIDSRLPSITDVKYIDSHMSSIRQSTLKARLADFSIAALSERKNSCLMWPPRFVASTDSIASAIARRCDRWPGSALPIVGFETHVGFESAVPEVLSIVIEIGVDLLFAARNTAVKRESRHCCRWMLQVRTHKFAHLSTPSHCSDPCKRSYQLRRIPSMSVGSVLPAFASSFSRCRPVRRDSHLAQEESDIQHKRHKQNYALSGMLGLKLTACPDYNSAHPAELAHDLANLFKKRK